jgi:hypothetical protein
MDVCTVKLRQFLLFFPLPLSLPPSLRTVSLALNLAEKNEPQCLELMRTDNQLPIDTHGAHGIQIWIFSLRIGFGRFCQMI